MHKTIWMLVAFGMAGCESEPEPEPCDTEGVFEDEDGDGFGNPNVDPNVCVGTEGFVTNGDDCDDGNPDIHPLADEVCDAVDNNCNGSADEGLPTTDWFFDGDSDGYGSNANNAITDCIQPDGWADNADDCDDNNPARNPGHDEICDGIDNDCDGDVDDQDNDQVETGLNTWYPDADEDGWGDPAGAGLACSNPPGAVAQGGDCDDADPAINPDAAEICDGIDNDCDTLTDDDDDNVGSLNDFYIDGDGDGYGDPDQVVQGCVPPPGAVPNGNDCDDGDPDVGNPSYWGLDADNDSWGAAPPVGPQCNAPNAYYEILTPVGPDCNDDDPDVYPGAQEVCNLGVDDDCDGLVDDDDPDVDVYSGDPWYLDADGDTWGDDDVFQLACGPPTLSHVANPGDCDDDDPNIHPGANEVCDAIDNNCDDLVDDDDPTVDPAGFVPWYADVDMDGLGDAYDQVLGCNLAGRVDNPDDCNDGDPLIGAETMWSTDADGDTVGDGIPVEGPGCSASPGLGPDWYGVDCDDNDPAESPLLPEICEDGLDNDCFRGDEPCTAPASCQDWLLFDPLRASGVLHIQPDAVDGTWYDVYCDMDVDGGGWTLVGSSDTPPDDAAGGYHDDLTTVEPAAAHAGIWDGMRAVIAGDSDIRFTCNVGPGPAAVDLSFYAIHWYDEITTGSDAASCFNEANGDGYDPPPERRDNVNADHRVAGDDWDAGYLEGEDVCGTLLDFTVDFDDRGMNSDESDGTDWGEDDGVVKCGVAGAGTAWHVWVRE